MAKKQSAKKSFDDESWRDYIEKLKIDDPHWWCLVTMLVETLTDHTRCIAWFVSGAEEGRRRAIYSLSRNMVMNNVRTLSKVPPEKCSVPQRICHYAEKVLAENDGIMPIWLMALVIKFLIFRAKSAHVGRIKAEEELERRMEEEYRLMQTVVDTGTITQGQPKANTRLRRRDEAWRDGVFVEDSPPDGPNLYVVLTGFYDPDLPAELVKVGVPLRCMLKIKREGEDATCDELRTPILTSSERTLFRLKSFNFDYGASSQTELLSFWSTIDKELLDLEHNAVFKDIAFVTFCPPPYSLTFDEAEIAIHRKDMYDRVSLIVYEIYDVLVKYSSYLNSMRLEHTADARAYVDDEIYKYVLDSLPLECVFVPTILHAMLLQVEANLMEATEEGSGSNRSSTTKKVSSLAALTDSDQGMERKSATEASALPDSFYRDMYIGSLKEMYAELELKHNYLLREEYDQENGEEEIEDQTESGDQEGNEVEDKKENPIHMKLILHGDVLSLRTHHVPLAPDLTSLVFKSKPSASSLAAVLVPILWEPRIFNLWDHHKKPTSTTLQMYRNFIDDLSQHFDRKTAINDEGIIHYLNFLAFEKMIQDAPSNLHISFGHRCSPTLPPSEPGKSRKEANRPVRRSTLNILRDMLDSLRLNPHGTIHPHLRASSSHGATPIIFSLADFDETTNNPKIQHPSRLEKRILEEYEDVELLPLETLLQTIYECFQIYGRFESCYFEPSDSILLYFGHTYLPEGGFHEKEILSSLRTDLSFREFYKYIIEGEEDYVPDGEEEKEKEEVREERYRTESLEVEEEKKPTFTDEDFILPESLKAKILRRKILGANNGDLSKNDKGKKQKVSEATKAAGDKKMVSTTVKGKELFPKGNKRAVSIGELDTSFLPHRTSLSFECAKAEEPHAFVGYDLGAHRLHLVNAIRTFFSADNTYVKVFTDDWLYGCKQMYITVILRGCCLRLNRPLVHAIRFAPRHIFHLETENGTILAFGERDEKNRRSDRKWMAHTLDFRASWPSGLIVEPVLGETSDDPFHIRQFYISKGPECANLLGESSRKFLRNGTVLKYMDDGTVIVMRPNSDIIICTDFAKDEIIVEPPPDKSSGKLKFQDDTKERRGKRRKVTPSEDGARTKSSSLATVATGGTGSEKMTAAENTFVHTLYKVSSYKVVHHDGRRYDVLNEQVVQEHDQLLARETSDYEVDEKFMRREDGTDMLFNSKSELIVDFADGTRIVTGCVIDEELEMCEWTPEEIERFFPMRTDHNTEGKEAQTSSHENVRGSLTGSVSVAGPTEKDAFVSIHLTCRMEHKNFATVCYDRQTVGCHLKMQDDLRISISPTSQYEVTTGNGVCFKAQEDTWTFSANACSSCDRSSVTTYNTHTKQRLRALEFVQQSSAILTTVDTLGDVFTVMCDGTAKYEQSAAGRYFYGNAKPCETFDVDEGKCKPDSEWSCQEDGIEEASSSASEKEGNDQIASYHGKGCKDFDTPIRNHFRIFAIHRDSTGHEYVHRSIKQEQEQVGLNVEGAAMFLGPIAHRPEINSLTTFLPPTPVTYSKRFLLEFPKVLETNHDRKDLIRSTYSLPYDWLFPYGRQGNGIWWNTDDVPITESIDPQIPQLLIVRVLQGFKESDRYTVMKLQRVLGEHWISVSYGSHKLVETEDVYDIEESIDWFEGTQRAFHDLALGLKPHIDLDTYQYGLKVAHTLSRLKKLEDHEESSMPSKGCAVHPNKSDVEWYALCFTENIVIPYFETINGACFLWVMDCVNKALQEGTEEESSEKDAQDSSDAEIL